MKTFRTILITFMVTVFVGFGGLFAILLGTGIVTIERETVEHTRMVVYDGNVTENTRKIETKGYLVKINVVDETYFGK